MRFGMLLLGCKMYYLWAHHSSGLPPRTTAIAPRPVPAPPPAATCASLASFLKRRRTRRVPHVSVKFVGFPYCFENLPGGEKPLISLAHARPGTEGVRRASMFRFIAIAQHQGCPFVVPLCRSTFRTPLRFEGGTIRGANPGNTQRGEGLKPGPGPPPPSAGGTGPPTPARLPGPRRRAWSRRGATSSRS